jgi:hypothetical protein
MPVDIDKQSKRTQMFVTVLLLAHRLMGFQIVAQRVREKFAQKKIGRCMTRNTAGFNAIARHCLMAAAIALTGGAIACSKDLPTSPGTRSDGPQAADRASILTALSCHASVVDRTVTCGQPEGKTQSAEQGPPDAPKIIIGGQDAYVSIKSSNVNYDAGTGAFTFDVTVRNLIFQPIGTADTTGGNALDANGVRVFFAAGPTVTGGSGLISVTGDGVATFTASNQPYYQYNTVLQPFQVSTAKSWQLNMPPTVTTFDFLLLVSAEVPRPTGYIDLQVSTLKPPTDRQVTYTVRNAIGTVDPSAGPITWSVSDTTRATIDGNGVVNPLRTGPVTIIAQAGTKVGSLAVTVQPIKRLWTGAVNTSWPTQGNWLPDGVKPEPADTAIVADSIAVTNWPVLVQNESVGGVQVLDITPGGSVPTISLGAFDLNASGDVTTTNSGAINNSSGRLFLSGIARTVGGTLPTLRVTGTYSLSANITTRGPLRVDLGRLRNSSFRIRTTSF